MSFWFWMKSKLFSFAPSNKYEFPMSLARWWKERHDQCLNTHKKGHFPVGELQLFFFTKHRSGFMGYDQLQWRDFTYLYKEESLFFLFCLFFPNNIVQTMTNKAKFNQMCWVKQVEPRSGSTYHSVKHGHPVMTISSSSRTVNNNSQNSYHCHMMWNWKCW